MRNADREYLVAVRFEHLNLGAGHRIPETDAAILPTAHDIGRTTFAIAYNMHGSVMTGKAREQRARDLRRCGSHNENGVRHVLKTRNSDTTNIVWRVQIQKPYGYIKK